MLVPDTTPVDFFVFEGVHFTASTQVIESRLVAFTVHAANPSEDSLFVVILGGSCMIRPRVYRQPGRDGFPVWLWPNPDDNEVCPQPGKLLDLSPGEAEDITVEFTVGLDAGTYFPTAVIDTSDGPAELIAGVIELQE